MGITSSQSSKSLTWCHARVNRFSWQAKLTWGGGVNMMQLGKGPPRCRSPARVEIFLRWTIMPPHTMFTTKVSHLVGMGSAKLKYLRHAKWWAHQGTNCGDPGSGTQTRWMEENDGQLSMLMPPMILSGLGLKAKEEKQKYKKISPMLIFLSFVIIPFLLASANNDNFFACHNFWSSQKYQKH